MGPSTLLGERVDPRRDAASLGWAVAVAGAGLLVARLWLLSSWAGSPILVLGYLGLLAAGATVPVPAPSAPRLSGAIALGVGLAAVGLAAFVAGPAPAVRTGALLPAVILNLLAAVAEEALFRRVLYGRLARYGAPAAILGSALVFSLVHVPLYGMAAFWVDLGAGLMLSWQRWACGSWTVPAATHAAANLLVVMG